MHRILASSLMLMLALIMATANSSAATINYQGQLADASGDPVADGSYQITFSLWIDSTGGENLWQELRDVAIESGHFSVYLGQVTPISTNIIGTANYLQIQVDAEILLP